MLKDTKQCGIKLCKIKISFNMLLCDKCYEVFQNTPYSQNLNDFIAHQNKEYPKEKKMNKVFNIKDRLPFFDKLKIRLEEIKKGYTYQCYMCNDWKSYDEMLNHCVCVVNESSKKVTGCSLNYCSGCIDTYEGKGDEECDKSMEINFEETKQKKAGK